VQWQKPEAGTVKINTDGSFQVESLVVATGAVIRDDNDAFLKAMVRQIPADGSSLMTEPQWKVILETDSLELVNLWHSHEKHRSEVHQIIQDIWVMSSVFSSFSVHHIKRARNLVAHTCASKASCNCAIVWEGSPPSFLLRQLMADCNHHDQ
jgi:hypothetical protein